jgi:hypothetical protein
MSNGDSGSKEKPGPRPGRFNRRGILNIDKEGKLTSNYPQNKGPS